MLRTGQCQECITKIVSLYRKASISLLLGFTAFAVLLLGLTFRHRIQNPLKMPIVKRSKLSDISNAVTEIKFSYPEAIHSVLVLGYSNQVPIESFAGGKIIVSNKNGRFELLLDQKTMTPCNWLDRFFLNGFLLSDPNAGSWDWNDILTCGSTNLLIITNVPAGGSIWLSYTRPLAWDLPLIGKRSKQSLEVVR